MELLSRFTENVRLGVVDNPHGSHAIVLTEKVTVCPDCFSLHSLRQHNGHVFCVDCDWTMPRSTEKEIIVA